MGKCSYPLGCGLCTRSYHYIFKKVSNPYPINQLTQEQALDVLKHRYDIEDWIKILLLERKRMMLAFESLACCEKVYPSNANFFLAKMKDAQSVYNYLCQKRNQGKELLQPIIM